MNILVPKSERIRSDRIRIGFGSDLHTSNIHTGQAEKLAWHTSPMICQLSYEAKSVRVCGISELSLVPSIPIKSAVRMREILFHRDKIKNFIINKLYS
jgi:hypothetical protein